MPKQENGGRAIMERGRIVIRVDIEALPLIVEGAWAAGGIGTRYKVTNTKEFASDLLNALNEENEDGTTRIHEMFDRAILEAIEQGAFGIEEHEEQEV